MAAGFAEASSLPDNTIALMLGAAIGPDGPRGVGNLNLKFAQDVVAFASGEFANSNDWAATAGLKMRW